ncbi:TetR/AcrR family transcriptional regulator [Rhodococcus sp. NBC_00294]|uniref:TetR/AcrR family transcriptional regulator n=1 Tax=Rhodococcus sp. NBC_00294 TaxID=2976004 RepID=UPI002E2E3A9B|nr:helix-turn-helix domain-containing protein [Rhodococcus sp. NBC_00294]
MPRPREFDTDTVLAAAVDTFVRHGYTGASVDQILDAVGIRRASLYNAFGSKRGLFLTALCSTHSTMPLLLVALMDLAPSDPSVRQEIREKLVAENIDARALGDAILTRACIERKGTA